MGQLLINADDFGISHDVNEAIIYCLKNDLIDRTTLLVNMPYTEEAIRMAREYGFEDRVGLHLNLVEGTPLSEAIRNTWLCDDNGQFNGSVSSSKYKRGLIDNRTLKCIGIEIDAQMKRFNSYELPLKHVDSHQHSHIKPSIFPVFFRSAKRNGFYSIRLAKFMPTNLSSMPTRLYKYFLNNIITNYNKRNLPENSRYPLITMADGYLGLKKELKVNGNQILKNNTEIWFHPSLVDGKLVNLYYELPFDVDEIQQLRVYK